MYIKSYQELIVWQRSIELVKVMYLLTAKFPAEEMYGLVSQMRRAAISIPSNIAEGYGRGSIKDYIRFYTIAYGSVLELETQIVIARELNYATLEDYNKVGQLLKEVAKMINAMLTKLKNKAKETDR